MTIKQGNVKECPRCKGIVLGGYAKCPECGYAFMNVDANSSAKLLDSRLNGVTDYEKRAHIISSFPIPNTREDLMEFLSALEPKAFARHKGDDNERKEKKAYYEKYVECLNKAKISFGDDVATQMFVEHYNADKRKLHLTQNQWVIVGFICFFAVLGIIGDLTSGEGPISNIINSIEKSHNKSMIPQYEEWKAKAYIEIQSYSDSLQNLLDELPTPTTQNYQECIKKISSITWKKSWAIPYQYNNKDIESNSSIREWGLEWKDKENFIRNKMNYEKLIGGAWNEELKKKGYNLQEIINTIPIEYR